MNATIERKVTAGGLGGAMGIVVVWLIGFGVEVPPEIAAAISTIIGIVAGYFTPSV